MAIGNGVIQGRGHDLLLVKGDVVYDKDLRNFTARETMHMKHAKDYHSFIDAS